MSYSSVGRRDTKQARRCRLIVQIGALQQSISIFPWTTVVELKQQIFGLFQVPLSQQRLFFGNTELHNSHVLNDYHILAQKNPARILTIEVKHPKGSFIRPCPNSSHSAECCALLTHVNQALQLGLSPNLTMDGTGGTYLLRDSARRCRGVFKPLDEEAFAPLNPRGYSGALGSRGLRAGVLSGEAGYREIAAFLVDKHFASVPETLLVESLHSSYCNEDPPRPKVGSFQAFIENIGCAEDFSCSLFSREQVQRVAVLDIRILNMDRNEANLLVRKDYSLVPIDHGLSFPDCFDITADDLCWMNWPQVKERVTPEVLDYLEAMDPLNDIETINNSFPFRDTCLMNIRVSGLLLKKGATLGLSLYDIGSLLYRKGYEEEPSAVEIIVYKAQQLYSSAAPGESKLKKRVENTVKARDRAFSSEKLEYPCMIGSPEKNANSGSDTSDTVVVPIPELDSEEEEDQVASPSLKGRSLSLPPLKKPQTRNEAKGLPLKSQDLAFDERFFHYIEAFIEQALAAKIKEKRPLLGPEGGRLRSQSNAPDIT